MTVRRVAASIALVFLVVLGTASAATAHALRIASDPDAGAVLKRGPDLVTITFGEEPDPSLSSITVLDSAGGHHEIGSHPTPEPGRPVVLTQRVQHIGNGVYTITWRTVSKVDGHLATGSFNFGVNVVPSAASSSSSVSSPSPSTEALIGRWLSDGGIIVLVGGTFVAGLASALAGSGEGSDDSDTADGRRRARRRLIALASGGWVAAFAGAIVITDAARSTAGLSWGNVFSHSLGSQLEQRTIPHLFVGLALIALAMTARSKRLERISIAALAIALAAAIAGEIQTSHASATTTYRWFALLVLSLHVSTAGVWIGGLAAVLLMVSVLAVDDRARLAQRYSLTIGGMLVLVGLTGSQRAYSEVGSWSALWDTTFGRWVLLKIVLFCVLGVLGAVNRWRSLPALRTSTRKLVRVGALELVIAAVVIVATGYLQNLAPSASSSAAAGTKPLVVNSVDAGTTVRVKLTIAPGYPGFNTFSARIVDYDTRKTVPATGVSLTFDLPARPDVGESRLNLRRAPGGMWQGDGANLSLPGTWTVAMLVQETSTSVEVPFSVTTRATPQTITKSVVPGQPTIYTIHVAGDRSIQVYSDLGRPGLYEVHVTFFDATGNELPIDQATVRAERVGTNKSMNLTTRRLDSLGHFVSDLITNGGTYDVDTDATAKDGAVVSGHIRLPLESIKR